MPKQLPKITLSIAPTYKSALIRLHISVFLWGFTAILGKLITLPSAQLVWWRMSLAVVLLLLWRPVRRALRRTTWRNAGPVFASGALLALHWVLFYASVKRGNPTTALIGLSLTSFFTAVLEPLFFRRRPEWRDWLIGLLVLPGMMLIYQNADVRLTTGLWLGIGAAIVLAVFSVLSKKFIVSRDVAGMTFWQMAGGAMALTLVGPMLLHWNGIGALPSLQDFLLLLVMTIFCTIVPFMLTLGALRTLSAFIANLTLNLEPVYGIAMAWVFLDDARTVNAAFVLGVWIVLLSVLVYPLLSRRPDAPGPK